MFSANPWGTTRATPWGFGTTPIRGALKGRDKGGILASIAREERDPSHEIEHHGRPFQGTCFFVFPTPGRCPRRTPRICTKHKAMLCRELRPFLSVCILAFPVCILGLYTQCRYINDHVIYTKSEVFPEKMPLGI